MSERRLNGGCFSHKEKTERIEIVMRFGIKIEQEQILIISGLFRKAVDGMSDTWEQISGNALLFHNFFQKVKNILS